MSIFWGCTTKEKDSKPIMIFCYMIAIFYLQNRMCYIAHKLKVQQITATVRRINDAFFYFSCTTSFFLDNEVSHFNIINLRFLKGEKKIKEKKKWLLIVLYVIISTYHHNLENYHYLLCLLARIIFHPAIARKTCTCYHHKNKHTWCNFLEDFCLAGCFWA